MLFSIIAMGLKNPREQIDQTDGLGRSKLRSRGYKSYHAGAMVLDMVSGVALLVLGSLVASGVISLGMPAAAYVLIGVGSFQFSIVGLYSIPLLVKAKECIK